MSARQTIASLLWWSVPSSTDEEAKERTEQLLDEHRVEVLREAEGKAREIVAKLWVDGTTQKQMNRADGARAVEWEIGLMASRNDEPAVAADFFQPGRTYTSGTWEFRCVAVSPSPTSGEPRTLGWKFAPVYDVHHWHATALDPDDWKHGDWTEATPARQGPVPQHYDKVPDPADGCHWCACGNRWPCKDTKAVSRG